MKRIMLYLLKRQINKENSLVKCTCRLIGTVNFQVYVRDVEVYLVVNDLVCARLSIKLHVAIG